MSQIALFINTKMGKPMKLKVRLNMILFCFTFAAITALCQSTLFAQENELALTHEAGFYYTIQRGDTLWDLSDQFFDSPWIWPELWNRNRQIPNPHWIYPGERIRLYQGEGTDKLTLTAPIQTASGTQMTLPEKSPYYTYAGIDQVGFIKKIKITANGSIFKVEGDHDLISTGDMVYIQPAPGKSLIPGSQHTVYRTMVPTTADTDDFYKSNTGTQYYLTGVVEIIEKKPDFVISRVMDIYREIKIGDRILPFRPRDSKIPLRPSPLDIKARIIVSEEHNELIGQGTTAFIDKGSKDGIEPGQQYSIYSQDTEKLDTAPAKTILLSPVDFGELLVLHTEKTTSTVIVTHSKKDIHSGDKVCSPLP